MMISVMKRLCLAMTLASLAASAQAAWDKIGESDDGMVVYADAATIQTSGGMVKMWALLDYKAAEKTDAGKPYSSAKLLHDYDCKVERARTRYFTLHSGKMGAGSLVYSEVRANSEWLPAQTTIIGESLWKIACGKK